MSSTDFFHFYSADTFKLVNILKEGSFVIPSENTTQTVTEGEL